MSTGQHPKKKHKPKPRIINDNTSREIVKYTPTQKAQENQNFINTVNQSQVNPVNPIDVIIDTVPNDLDSSIQYPVKYTLNIPQRYFMQFESARHVLYNPDNKLTLIDFYLFHYLCDHYSQFNQFFIAAPFWYSINQDMQRLKLTYSQQSIKNSLTKLHKAKLILKMSKGCYAINKILIFTGPLNQRVNEIQNQFINQISKSVDHQ